MVKRAIRKAVLAAAVGLLAGAWGALANPARAAEAAAKPQFSGVYPHLAYFNNEGECGTGAVVPFGGRLWVITYGPHLPKGSSDKLYEVDEALNLTVRPESIGGTPANRMIHRESGQLFIGPYAIDKDRNVRAISYKDMPGRHTANMRHLTDPANKVYYATMEEGFYEVDVKTLAVTTLFEDGNSQKDKGSSLLPGYHGKGAYTAQGRVVYANNGELSDAAKRKPFIPSGVLAEWEGAGKEWRVVRRNQFTEVTGPGGIHGNENPATDPLWSVGWDHRSLILMTLADGKWSTFRLPKASHTYDGAHGWNTEWPRIREIGEGDDLLMTMHGTFWRFPRAFATPAGGAAGIRPRSTYLRVIGDFARWKDRVVFGCDDTAKAEFLNKRKAKGELAGPGQSQSNLWFVEPSQIDKFGPAVGRGAVWATETAEAGKPSDPFLFAGYDRRAVHLSHASDKPVTFEFEVDADGKGNWKALRSIPVPAKGYTWVEFNETERGEWVRVTAKETAEGATAQFHYANADKRSRDADPIFASWAKPGDAEVTGGLVRARGENKRTLQVAASTIKGTTVTDGDAYELDENMKLVRAGDPKANDWMRKHVAIPEGVLALDAASVLFVDDAGRRWRLPRGGDASLDAVVGKGLTRIDREICTERDMFNAHGTFYELPAENAAGFARVRSVTTHNRLVHDFCTYRGLLIVTGLTAGGGAGANDPHVIRSDDGKAAVWAGVVDDLWRLGKPVGQGGPWKESAVKANAASDAYLMNGYDRKKLTLKQAGADAVKFRVEVDVTGDGNWQPYRSFDVAPNVASEHAFPDAFHAYWVRVVADKDCTATAWFEYE